MVAVTDQHFFCLPCSKAWNTLLVPLYLCTFAETYLDKHATHAGSSPMCVECRLHLPCDHLDCRHAFLHQMKKRNETGKKKQKRKHTASAKKPTPCACYEGTWLTGANHQRPLGIPHLGRPLQRHRWNAAARGQSPCGAQALQLHHPTSRR